MQMKNFLYVLLFVAPFSVLGIFISINSHILFLWYVFFSMIALEVVLRIYTKHRDGIWKIGMEVVWIPYHAFAIYIFVSASILNVPILVPACLVTSLIIFVAIWKVGMR